MLGEQVDKAWGEWLETDTGEQFLANHCIIYWKQHFLKFCSSATMYAPKIGHKVNIDKKLDTFRVRLTSWCYVSIAKQRKGWEVMATTREQELLFINFEFKRAKKNMCLWHPHSNLRVRVSKMFERNRHCHTNRQDSDSSVDGVHHT